MPSNVSRLRLLVVVGGAGRAARSRPRPRARPDDPGVPLDLPDPLRDGGLATVVAAPDGRLAAIGQDGDAWQAPPPRAVSDRRPTGMDDRSLGLPPEPGLPGPVLGATWSIGRIRARARRRRPRARARGGPRS